MTCREGWPTLRLMNSGPSKLIWLRLDRRSCASRRLVHCVAVAGAALVLSACSTPPQAQRDTWGTVLVEVDVIDPGAPRNLPITLEIESQTLASGEPARYMCPGGMPERGKTPRILCQMDLPRGTNSINQIVARYGEVRDGLAMSADMKATFNVVPARYAYLGRLQLRVQPAHHAGKDQLAVCFGSKSEAELAASDWARSWPGIDKSRVLPASFDEFIVTQSSADAGRGAVGMRTAAHMVPVRHADESAGHPNTLPVPGLETSGLSLIANSSGTGSAGPTLSAFSAVNVGTAPMFPASVRSQYLRFLNQPRPRALSVSRSAMLGFSASGAGAVERALSSCNVRKSVPTDDCVLVAVDDTLLLDPQSLWTDRPARATTVSQN